MIMDNVFTPRSGQCLQVKTLARVGAYRTQGIGRLGGSRENSVTAATDRQHGSEQVRRSLKHEETYPKCHADDPRGQRGDRTLDRRSIAFIMRPAVAHPGSQVRRNGGGKWLDNATA
jgi:hypothetical protein